MNLLVTGGSRGIGRAIVLRALAAGHDVAFTYHRDPGQGADTLRAAGDLAGRRCRAYPLDVRKGEQVAAVVGRMAADFGGTDAAVMNAGVTCRQLLIGTSDELWDEVLDINLNGSFRVARALLPGMLARGAGSLVFVGSIAQEGMSGAAPYAASKAGLLGLSATLAREYGARGVRSNLIVAGPFDTELSRQVSDETREQVRRYSPAGRGGEAAELAEVALFLASSRASFVNGAAVNVSGGFDWLA